MSIKVRRRNHVSASVVLATLLAVLAVTPAFGAVEIKYHVLNDECLHFGTPAGTLKFAVRVKEFGYSGVNYFRILSKAQYRAGGHWYQLQSFGWEQSSNFPDDADNYYHELKRRYDFDGLDGDAVRMRMKIESWSNTQGLIASKVLNGEYCTTAI